MADNAEAMDYTPDTDVEEVVLEDGAAAVSSNTDTEATNATEVEEETTVVESTESAPAVAANNGGVDKTKEFSRGKRTL